MSRHCIEGAVVFRRASPDGEYSNSTFCREQCGPKGHIEKRLLVLDQSAGLPVHSALERTLEAFLSDRVLKNNDNDGKRVRIIVEVLDEPQ